jgi:hypothetical protein
MNPTRLIYRDNLEAVAVAPLLFDLIHRDIRILDQRLRVRIGCDPDARGYMDLVRGDAKRELQGSILLERFRSESTGGNRLNGW